MHCKDYLKTTAEIALSVDALVIEAMAVELARVRQNFGRVFMVGLGGSLANAMHMAADLRKLCLIDAYAPDNLAELTAWANDHGFSSIFDGYLRRISNYDCLFVLSVGGGTETVSKAIGDAVKKAKKAGASVIGIVGPNGGTTKELADVCLSIPAPERAVTPHSEAFQAVIWHALVSHPLLQRASTKW